MTGNKCLLDTSIIIHSFKSNNTIGERLDAIAEIYVPVTVIGELFYGAYKSANLLKHISQVQSFLFNCRVLMPDAVTANTYGQIKASLMKKGKPLPENDIWIAAIARQYNLPLFTTDNHFRGIDHLTLLN